MNELTKLVTIEHNDDNSVILKVKKNKRLDLIKTGYFNGDEEMIRITKTKDDCCGHSNYTFFLVDGKHYEASDNTLVSDAFKKKMKLVYETVHDDFGIHLKGKNINITNYIKTIKDDKKVKHCFRMVWCNNDNIIVYKDDIWFKKFKNVQEAERWIESRYDIERKTDGKSVVDTDCNIRTIYTKVN